MKDPVFDIHIGQGGVDTTVVVNGHDITRHLVGVTVEVPPGKLTKVTLLVRPGLTRTTVQAAIADITVADPPTGVDA